MRRRLILLSSLALCACGQVDRNNPADPHNNAEEGIQLIAALPGGDVGGDRLADFRFEVSGEGMEPVVGSLNLVGTSATALVQDVPLGTARVFRVDARL